MALVRENSSVPSQLRTYGDVATRAMHRDTMLNGGTTVDLNSFKVPAKTDGYFVGGAPNFKGDKLEAVIITEAEFTLSALRRAFGFLYAEHLTAQQISDSTPIENGFIGTWMHEGLVFVDASNWTADYTEAVQWAIERGEHSIYDVQANGSLELASITRELQSVA